MKLPLVYIAGLYSNGDTPVNVARAMKVWHDLWGTGLCAPVLPHLSMYLHMVRPLTWEEWLDYDLQVLARCDAVFHLSGESAGAAREVSFARDHNIPVFSEAELGSWARLEQWCAKWKAAT